MTLQNFELDLASITIVMIALLLLQTLFFIVILLQFIRRIGSLERHLSPLLTTAGTNLASLRSMLAAVAPAAKELAALQEEVISILNVVGKTMRHGDELLGRSVSLLRSFRKTADRTVGEILNQFSEKSFTVYQAVLHPAHKVSAVLRALHETVQHLFSRRRPETPAWHLQDQDLFI